MEDLWGTYHGIGIGAERRAREADECYVAAWYTIGDQNRRRWTEQIVDGADVHRAEGFGVYESLHDGTALWLVDFSTAKLALDWAHRNCPGVIYDYTKGR